ncbi:MAG: hypothetical protein DRH04_02550 [Deltaproteobacteria bacterium]|nr:MAG: hypothetical protein DRH04_02550 [Deltaproteobacteria bacterium]
MNTSNEKITIIIDTREQLPYRFPHPTLRKALPAGDYSLLGYESKMALERKTKADAYGTIGKGRSRFVVELERLATYDYAAIIVESSLSDFLKPPPRSKLHPKSAINSLIAWSIRYNISVFFTDNRTLGQTVALRLLEKYWKGQQHHIK